MKLPSKYIAALVILSLAGIFAYQVYWLSGLYRTMRNDMERNILEAMRMSDYNEMMLRVDEMRKDSTDHGDVNVSAGFEDDGGVKKTYVRSSTTIDNNGKKKMTTTQRVIPQKSDTLRMGTGDEALEQALTEDKEPPQAALRAQGGLDMILRDQNSMMELATYFQRGLHSGLDIISDPNVLVYDSLLTTFLKQRGIHLPHRLEHIYSGGKSPEYVFTDTLAVTGTPGYIPSTKAKLYTYSFDLSVRQSYRLWMEPVTPLILKQMSGILITSFVILIILSFAFWYLIRIILRQKTLEEMKSDFTNNITHELKTPIAVAYAANDALLNFNQAEDKAQRDKYLAICQEQLQRLSGLVEQILSMSMERRKTFRLHPEEIKVSEIIEKLVEQHKLKSDKPVEFSVAIEPDDLTVVADRTHLTNIISNLIDNAIKYSCGKAEVEIRCRRISSTEQGWQTEISVSDHGTGIPAEKLKHVFDKFYRVPTGNLHDVKGYGLGLFYVKTLTERHGGTVTVKSEPDKGSVFTIII